MLPAGLLSPATPPTSACLPACHTAPPLRASRPAADGGEACPLSGLQRSPTGMSVRNNLDFITTNATGAQVVFLWGQSAPNGIR